MPYLAAALLAILPANQQSLLRLFGNGCCCDPGGGGSYSCKIVGIRGVSFLLGCNFHVPKLLLSTVMGSSLPRVLSGR